MSRWRSDPDAAAAQLIGGFLETIAVCGRVLIANAENGAELASRLAERGIGCDVWMRRLGDEDVGAQTWPPAGPFACVLLRLPRAKDEQAMAIDAAIGVLAPAGRLIVYGGNDEGIRSAAGIITRTCGDVETLAAKGHGRILAARRPADLAAVRGTLAAWRRTTIVPIAGAMRAWISYPGVFAAGRIDAATSLLLGAMPKLPRTARLLDFGCGSGVIGASALAQGCASQLDMLDNDAVALAAAAENVPQGRAILARGINTAPDGYDAILSNPPLHRGIAEDHRLLHALIDEAPGHLRQSGVLQIVVQRRIAIAAYLARRFARIDIAAESRRYRVWRAER